MADRDDNYRGYGRPGGRYYEGRDYGRGGYGGGDRGRDGYRGDRDDDRGFFERAGEEIRSWFSDDDDRPRERGYGDHDRDRDRNSGAYGMGGRGREEGRGGYYGNDRGERSGPRSGGSAYGAAGYGSAGGSGQRREGSHPHDEHYGEWRHQQMSELDRDYAEYRHENREKFQNEFATWRGNRQQQRTSVRQVKEHMEVVGSDGQPVGTVDKVAGDKIILTKTGAMAGGHHHSIPCSWLQSVDDKVTINKTAEDARKQWTDEENRRALFESEDQRRSDGPHFLDRSFSGTYDR